MLEDNLRTLFTLEAEADQPPSHISVPAAGPSARARQRQRRALTIGSPVLAAAAVIAVIATSVSLAGGDERTARPTRPATPLTVPGSAGWARLPRAPIAPRSEYAAVWTGKQMIVWGGYSNTDNYGDGAAYDPATRTWTKIAAGPLARRVGAMAVWTGKDMLMFGGVNNSHSYSDGAAYDPATNTWRKLAPIPSSLGGNLTDSGSYAVWTGKVMVAWGFFGHGGGAHGGGSLAAATYNPAANSWTTGTVAPAQAPLFGDAFWTGKEMIVWGSSPASGASPGHLEGFAYDPATQRWSTLPASPLGRAGRDSMLAAWTGSYLVVGGGDGSAGLQKDAAAYDPVTSRWIRLPDAPVGFEGNGTAADIWTGVSVITIEDAVSGGRPLSLDLTTRSWSLGPKAPVPGRQEAHELWTGSEVLVWGGGVPVGNYCCKTVKPGYSYTP
jgi:Galactose oxidase, central domain